MKRELVVNWCEGHLGLKSDLEKDLKDTGELRPVENGWSYITFFTPGIRREDVLFNIKELELAAQENGYFLPEDLIRQHNKVVICATCSADSNGALCQYAIHKLLGYFADSFHDPQKHPNLSFYGKVGGIYDRVEKGRVLVIYAPSDDGLLEIEDKINSLTPRLRIPGVEFSSRLANGLSALPRMLHGYNDPDYASTGVHYFRITDKARFTILLEQARNDFGNYLFR